MDNFVLKLLSVRNYASFADCATFTTAVDTSKKEHLDKTFAEGDFQYNRVSFLYGANGSGKTFFCKALIEIQRLLTFSPLTMADPSQLLTIPHFKHLGAPVAPFAFDYDYINEPTTFCIEVVLNGTIYHYEFSLRGKTVIYELLTKKRRRTEKLLERTSPRFKDIVVRSDLKSFEPLKSTVKEEALCLPIAGMLNNPLAAKLVAGIQNINVVSMTSGKLDPLDPEETFSPERLKRYITIMQKADPTIRDIKVIFEEEEIARNKLKTDDFENREVVTRKLKVGVDSRHAVYQKGCETSETSINFFADESLGTIKLFTALPYLFDVLENGGTLVIDEIENGLHLSLAREIVQLFMSEDTNPFHAQLVCTSHQPLLVNGDFRRDQVWITSKDSHGKTSLHRMSDLKSSRAKVNLTNRILEGAFGCNPDLFFENNT